MSTPDRKNRFTIFKSVRARTTAAAMLVVAIALLLAAVAILEYTRRTASAAAVSLARNQISDIALLLKGGEIQDPLPVPRGDLGVQIFDARGKVVATTANIASLGALARVSLGASSVLSSVKLGDHKVGSGINGDTNGMLVGQRLSVAPDGLRVVKYQTSPTSDYQKAEVSEHLVDTAGPPLVSGGKVSQAPPSVFVLVWSSLASEEQANHAIETSLFILYPLLLLLVGILVWVMTGRALEPVEKIRAEVEGISGANLHSRVYVPPTRDEIAKLASTMNEMLDRLETSSERMREFVSDASHELKSPIASIRAELEVSLLHPEATEMPAALMAALDEAGRMQRIVEDLLTLAKIDEKVIHPKFENVDIDEIVAAEARRIRLQQGKAIDASNVGAARIVADSDQIFRVVRNLLENAARHAKSKVSVSLRVVDSMVELRICDDGPGIPAEMKDKIFERFHRVDEDRSRNSGGSGLGLAIVASLVKLHNGTVGVSAEPSRLGGAEFIVRLPADPAYLGQLETFQPIHSNFS